MWGNGISFYTSFSYSDNSYTFTKTQQELYFTSGLTYSWNITTVKGNSIVKSDVNQFEFCIAVEQHVTLVQAGETFMLLLLSKQTRRL